jgi:hypothetical protein
MLIKLVKALQGYAQIPYLMYGQSQTLIVGGNSTPVAAVSNSIRSSCVLIQSTVNIRFKVSALGTVAGNFDPVGWAGTDIFVGFAGSFISVIKMDGQPDGQVIITPVSEE